MSKYKSVLKHLSYVCLIFAIFIAVVAGCDSNNHGQEEATYIKSLNDERAEKYHELIDSTTSRFNMEERAQFVNKKLDYFEPDFTYFVNADFKVDTSTPVFEMQTTTDRKPKYRIYGYINFKINDTSCKLTVYQNVDYKNHPEHGKYLFIPFKDNTNEFSTYGGGRYIDIGKTSSQEVMLDFNTAYNPYCAYNDRWSCPLIPFENQLDVSIFAGEKIYK